MLKEKAKIQLRDLLPVILILAVAGLAAIFVLQIMGDVRGDLSANTAEINATDKVTEGLGKITAKFPTVGLIIVAALLIGILLSAFAKRF